MEPVSKATALQLHRYPSTVASIFQTSWAWLRLERILRSLCPACSSWFLSGRLSPPYLFCSSRSHRTQQGRHQFLHQGGNPYANMVSARAIDGPCGTAYSDMLCRQDSVPLLIYVAVIPRYLELNQKQGRTSNAFATNCSNSLLGLYCLFHSGFPSHPRSRYTYTFASYAYAFSTYGMIIQATA